MMLTGFRYRTCMVYWKSRQPYRREARSVYAHLWFDFPSGSSSSARATNLSFFARSLMSLFVLDITMTVLNIKVIGISKHPYIATRSSFQY